MKETFFEHLAQTISRW